MDRVLALKDMVSPTTRRKISDVYNTVSQYTRSGLWIGAKGAYAISVSALFIGIPFSLLFVDDSMMAEQEKEMKMREMGSEVSYCARPSRNVLARDHLALCLGYFQLPRIGRIQNASYFIESTLTK